MVNFLTSNNAGGQKQNMIPLVHYTFFYIGKNKLNTTVKNAAKALNGVVRNIQQTAQVPQYAATWPARFVFLFNSFMTEVSIT